MVFESEFRGRTIYCKSAEVELHLDSLHTILGIVLEDAIDFAERLGWTLTITSVYRTPREDAALGGSRVHCQVPHRAIDIRTLGIEPVLVADLDRHLDTTWIYDPRRPKLTVSYEAEHGNAPHLHIQVTDKTVRRG